MTPTLREREYDDGTASIPGGITLPVEKVVVIGAGIAGLTAASALTTAGVDCIVLEGRDRIGGRLHTVDLGATPVDLGGSWIHHPDGNPLRRFVAEQGLDAPPGDPLPTIGGYDAVEERRLSEGEVAETLELLEGLGDALESLRASLPAQANAADGIERFIEHADLEPGRARRARQGLRAIIEADAADEAERQSLAWLWNELEYGGDLFGDLPADGYRSVVQAMAGGLDVRCGCVVEEVSVRVDDVLVRLSDGQTHAASHVVVTVPLGVLKSGALTFSPELPEPKRRAVSELGFGHYEKVVLAFDRPFWRDHDLSHLMYFPDEADQPTTFIFDLDAFGTGPVLAAHIFHSATHRVLEADQSSAVSWVMGMVAGTLGAPCPQPIATTVTQWATDPFARGAYTHVPPGSQPAQLDLLGEPAFGRVLFAGEHTYGPRMGYADGAMSSGVREAKRLLQRRSVRLDGLDTERTTISPHHGEG